MIDKVWYEWQLRDSSNKNAFAGGSISRQVDPTVPITGGPPMLNVCGNHFQLVYACSNGTDVRQLSSVIPGDGLWEDVTIRDVMSTVGGRLCYTYS